LELAPSGQPVRSGWISSDYGMRRDPITGERTFHAGVDFVSRRGADVLAAASGVVIFAGVRSGYGRVVEIDHGNGYVTRYAHNKENLVKAGALVGRGDVIALLGASGRTTGPHVHFEVLADGQPVDPAAFILASPDS
jgi:murein DD-endopeptidase MepM/ murein hydrolase activator NlpD